MTADTKDDLHVWLTFLSDFNGVSFWQNELRLEAELQVHSDAAGSLDFGVYFRGHCCAEDWPSQWVEMGWTRDLTFWIFSDTCCIVVVG